MAELLKCSKCGRTLSVIPEGSAVICDACGTVQSAPNRDNGTQPSAELQMSDVERLVALHIARDKIAEGKEAGLWDAIEKLKMLGDWQDAPQLLKEAEQKQNALRQKKKKSRILLAAAAAVVLCVTAGFTVGAIRQNRMEAEQLRLEAEEQLRLEEEAQRQKEAEELEAENNAIYNDAVQLLNWREYRKAAEEFRKIEDYRDSAELATVAEKVLEDTYAIAADLLFSENIIHSRGKEYEVIATYSGMDVLEMTGRIYFNCPKEDSWTLEMKIGEADGLMKNELIKFFGEENTTYAIWYHAETEEFVFVDRTVRFEDKGDEIVWLDGAAYSVQEMNTRKILTGIRNEDGSIDITDSNGKTYTIRPRH